MRDEIQRRLAMAGDRPLHRLVIEMADGAIRVRGACMAMTHAAHGGSQHEKADQRQRNYDAKRWPGSGHLTVVYGGPNPKNIPDASEPKVVAVKVGAASGKGR
jgi:hypothetical protein